MKRLLLQFGLICMFLSLGGLSAFSKGPNQALKVDVYLKQGQVYLRTLEYSKAIKWFDKAIALDKKHAKAYHLRGTAYFYSKQIEQACQDWKTACELDTLCQGWQLGKAQFYCIEVK